MNVGFIGLGRMGEPMARKMLTGGHSLFVHDVSSEACQALAADGAERLDSPAGIAARADIVLTSLPGPREVEAVMMGAHGVFTTVRQNAIVVDTSTVGPSLSRQMARRFSEKGASYLDGPVSGGQEGAAAGTLTVMVGGDEGAFERARPILSLIGSNLYYMGPSGSGNAVKLIVQMIYLSYVAVFCEGLSLGEKIGIPFDRFFEVLVNSSAGKPGIEKRYEMLKENDLTPRFEIDLGLKDLALALEICVRYHQSPVVTQAASEAYQRAKQLGLGGKDLTALRALDQDLLGKKTN